jgi:6,7-dimethyl-8-ribityllumazine synthase
VTSTVAGNEDGSNLRVGVCVASWNQSITDRLLDGALTRLAALQVSDVTVLRVPGALELPVGARALAEAGHEAVVALGAVIKGDTDHYDIVVRESSSGIAAVSLTYGIPVTNGVLAVHRAQDALDRSGPGDANKGAEAAQAAVLAATALKALTDRDESM